MFSRPAVRAAQLDMLRRVAQRLCDELEEIDVSAHVSEPLLWCLHGLPGTGKTEVLLMIKEMFQEVCGWQLGVEFQIMSLQAVTAQLFGGDTIHHACGINPFGHKTDPKTAQKAAQRQTEVAERIARVRWISIDEISMVSA